MATDTSNYADHLYELLRSYILKSYPHAKDGGGIAFYTGHMLGDGTMAMQLNMRPLLDKVHSEYRCLDRRIHLAHLIQETRPHEALLFHAWANANDPQSGKPRLATLKHFHFDVRIEDLNGHPWVRSGGHRIKRPQDMFDDLCDPKHQPETLPKLQAALSDTDSDARFQAINALDFTLIRPVPTTLFVCPLAVLSSPAVLVYLRSDDRDKELEYASDLIQQMKAAVHDYVLGRLVARIREQIAGRSIANPSELARLYAQELASILLPNKLQLETTALPSQLYQAKLPWACESRKALNVKLGTSGQLKLILPTFQIPEMDHRDRFRGVRICQLAAYSSEFATFSKLLEDLFGLLLREWEKQQEESHRLISAGVYSTGHALSHRVKWLYSGLDAAEAAAPNAADELRETLGFARRIERFGALMDLLAASLTQSAERPLDDKWTSSEDYLVAAGLNNALALVPVTLRQKLMAEEVVFEPEGFTKLRDLRIVPFELPGGRRARLMNELYDEIMAEVVLNASRRGRCANGAVVVCPSMETTPQSDDDTLVRNHDSRCQMLVFSNAIKTVDALDEICQRLGCSAQGQWTPWEIHHGSSVGGLFFIAACLKTHDAGRLWVRVTRGAGRADFSLGLELAGLSRLPAAKDVE